MLGHEKSFKIFVRNVATYSSLRYDLKPYIFVYSTHVKNDRLKKKNRHGLKFKVIQSINLQNIWEHSDCLFLKKIYIIYSLEFNENL